MPNMTLSLDAETMRAIKEHPEIKWSEVARQAFQEKLRRLRLLSELDAQLADSQLTEDDTLDLGASIRKGIGKRLKAGKDAPRP